jgi:hypothetical protein
VDWVAVTKSSDEIGEPVAFDPSLGTIGDYADVTPSVLAPFQGYFLKNDSSEPETLWIPPIEATGAAARDEETAPLWQLRLTAANRSASAGAVILGSHPEARADLDRFDREKPPAPPGRWVSVAIVNRDWQHRAGLYRRDLRDADADGHTWQIEILTQEKAEDVTLSGSWDRAPAGDLALRLVDVEQGVSVDLRGGDAIEEYRLVSFGSERPYRLAILAGTPAWVLREGDALVERPVSLSLDGNAPNPFRDATRIRFGLPRPTTASLTIFNLEGRRVARLVDGGTLPAGFHTAVWDGRDDSGRRVAAGIYFCRLETGDAVLHRKLLVLR